MRHKLDERYEAGLRQRIPARMIGGIMRYLEDGILPGGFLQAILKNDLVKACEHADDENKYLIWDYVNALYNYAPAEAWGSPEAVSRWMAKLREGDHKEEASI